MRLVDRLGFDPVDAGGRSSPTAPRSQPHTPPTNSRSSSRAEFLLRRKGTQYVTTCTLAPTAHLDTDTAMRMMVRVPLALLGTRPAGLETRLNGGASKLRHELRLSTKHSPCRNADVAAVQTQHDAAQKHLHLRLSHAGVSATGAALRAVEARLDARDQRLRFDLRRSRMSLEHLSRVSRVRQINRLRAWLQPQS